MNERMSKWTYMPLTSNNCAIYLFIIILLLLFILPFIYSFFRSFIISFILSSISTFIISFILSFVHPFVHSFIQSFGYSIIFCFYSSSRSGFVFLATFLFIIFNSYVNTSFSILAHLFHSFYLALFDFVCFVRDCSVCCARACLFGGVCLFVFVYL